MKSADFLPGFPGRLAPTLFTQAARDGRVRTTTGDSFVPNPLPPDLDHQRIVGRLYDVLDRAKTNLLRLEAVVDSLPDPTLLLAAMQSREAQVSSKIENTFASLRDVALAEYDQFAQSEAQEVRRNRLAIHAGLTSRLPVSTRLVCDMHRRLIIDPRHRPGHLRDRQVCIGDEHLGFDQARFVPPPPAELEQCMTQWEQFCNPNALGVPARVRWPDLIELAMNHYQFEAIHPFSDGNGPLGRAIVNVTPVKSGFLRHPVCNPSEWVHANRQEYYDRLRQVSTQGEWEPWLRFFCTALAEQAQLDLKRVERVKKLYDRYASLVSGRRKSSLVMKLIQHLFRSQAVTISIAAKTLEISYTAAQRHVEFLVKEKILQRAGTDKYAKVYVATGIIRAIRGQGED